MKNRKHNVQAEINKPLFTDTFTKRVRLALELNRNEHAEIYHHPSEKRIVQKCIDLSCKRPLHAIGTGHSSFSSDEKWLEAYLISLAKTDAWHLQLINRRFQFIYSQLNFRGSEGNPPRPLDLLLYESDTASLIIFELKAKRELGRAISELTYYSRKINECKAEIAHVFNIKEITGAQGFIVWPKNERADNNKHDFHQFGLIEYSKLVRPWEAFKESGDKPHIEFVCVKSSEVIEKS